jgi:hypothetical protein
MISQPPPPLSERVVSWIPFVLSAAVVATAIDVAVRRPTLGLVVVEVSLVLLIPQLLHRRKLRRVLRSGDVDAVLSAWEASVDRLPHPETMAPLITATALAAHGLSDRARRALTLARRGPAWEAAIEQRLVLDILLAVFDGEPERSLAAAAAMQRLPLPISPFLRSRVTGLRAAMAAFARAFAHRTERDDLPTLKAAARQNPLVFWAMRYAAAVASIDSGKPVEAARLLEGAPRWPHDSVFAAFHREIAEHAAPHP